ncbi:MAG TPA: DUF3866 family protein [Chthonomonadaceae bacterium]|nr:DUF3866 family protein [Chthonomonadaceae bacterium]
MKQRLEGVVDSIVAERPGAQEISVRVRAQKPGRRSAHGDALRPALNLLALTGRVEVGDRVLLNTTAVEMGLGSGGLDFVVAALDRLETDAPPPGHILKLRYTPMQMPVLAVEAPESPHHDALRLFATLDDLPVVCAELHSQLPAICAAAKWALEEYGEGRKARIAYVMTDGASLPMGLSRLVPQLKAKGLLDATITAGQAFGGDYEAVNLYSALVAAREVAEADIIVVAQGPGNVGTATPLGFSGIDQGLAINAVASLGGVPVAAARVSFADPRDRHNGLSHHTVTVLRHVARAPALVPIPRLPETQRRIVQAALEKTGIAEKHQPITVDAHRGLAALEACGLDVTTMGRSLAQERPFFLSAAAAGLLAAQLVEARSP